MNSILRTGKIKSCGCFKSDCTRIRFTIHGNRRNAVSSGAYQSWQDMLRRCCNQNIKGYKNYGGRGIVICEEWSSFKRFLNDMGCRPDGCTLERKDVNGNYCPLNCVWATRAQQSRNTRRTRMFTIDGITACMKDHANMAGISYGTIVWRLERGWTPELAFKTPASKYFRRRAEDRRGPENPPDRQTTL